MGNLGKGIALCVLITSLLITSQMVRASSIHNLSWLPLLSSSFETLQLDKNCPQNKISGLVVKKDKAQINADIQQVNWDLNCTNTPSSEAPPLTNTEKNQQVELFLNHLSTLPSLMLRVNAIRLISELIKGELTSTLRVAKTDSHFTADLNNELFNAELVIDLTSKKLTLALLLHAEKLPEYINLTDNAKRYFNNDLQLSYQSDLTDWHQGEFTLSWQGSLPDYAEQAELLIAGRVDLITEQVTLSTLSFNAKQLEVSISETQRWKSSYLKIKLSAPAHFNYGQLNIEKLPLHLRVGRSLILTDIERGKSKRIRVDKQKLPALFSQLVIQGNKTALSVDWVLNLLNQKITGKLLLDEALVKLQIKENSINLTGLIASLHEYIDVLSQLEISTGTLKADLSLEYDRITEQLRFDSQLRAKNVEGKNDDILFDGTSLNSQLNYVIDKQKNITIYKDEQTLKIDNLFVGLPIQALQVDAQLNAGEAVVHHFKARLLGGRIDFDDFNVNAPSHTILNVAGISLAELIKYSAYPEIKSKAVIDGMLPLSLTEAGPEISEGMIFARPPGGYIKVPENTVIKAMGRGNPAFSFTMQLLSNFQFDTMQGKIGYTSDGESDLRVEIKGISPNVSGVQPVNFSYTHAENILKLLKSLRFNEELVRDIEERY